MFEKSVKVINRLGLHARPSAMFVTYATRYKSEIFVEKDRIKVNGKSIMGIMSLAAEKGSKLIISANGEDEKEAVKVLVKLVESGFGELINL